jgi:hypothetical protein
MKFDIYDLVQPALILPLRTGVIYNQQTAGHGCNQNEIEGALLPIPEQFLTKELLRIASEDDPITDAGADAIDRSWKDINSGVIHLMVDRQRLLDSEEAWVFVKVIAPPYSGTAVLTWENSD